MNQQMAEAAMQKLLKKEPGRIPPHHFKIRPEKAKKEKAADTVPSPPQPETALPWVTQNTAILIVHGIGNQMPMETLDMLGRGLVCEYARDHDGQVTFQHCVVTREPDSSDLWFD